MNDKNDGNDWEIVHAYTRREAIEDGVLVDVTQVAHEAGFRWPVALTRTAWCGYVEVPEGVDGQDEQGRLWDILIVLHHQIRTQTEPHGGRLHFTVLVRNDSCQPRKVRLKCVLGPDDNGGPCLTVMLPDED